MIRWTGVISIAILLCGCAAGTDVTLFGSLLSLGFSSAEDSGDPALQAGGSVTVNAPVDQSGSAEDAESPEETQAVLQALVAQRSVPASANVSVSLQELLDLRDGHAQRMSNEIEQAVQN